MAIGAVVLGTAALPAETGCSTRQCVPGYADYGGGGWADPATKTLWVTALDINQPWIPYGGNVEINIHFDDTHRFPVNVTVYVGVTEHGTGSPNLPAPPQDMFGPNYAQAAGQLAVFAAWETDHVVVKNSTCGDYVMYAMIQFSDRFPCPLPGGKTFSDAFCTVDGGPYPGTGSDPTADSGTEASIPEAGSDATADAGIEASTPVSDASSDGPVAD
jgi:hypothetical protein